MFPETASPSSHPMDSSRILLGLMALSRKAAEARSEESALDGVISTSVLRSLLSALRFRDVATVRHSRRVAMLSVGMAEYLGWDGRQLRTLEVAALLHDIGKIGVPDNILFKPGRLSADEIELMSLHHNIGVDVLQACRVESGVLDIVVHAHTHFGGGSDGYRTIGSDVPMGARILAVADAYDSLQTDQVYRKGKTHAEIMQILADNVGTQFDGNIVAALGRWSQESGSKFTALLAGEPGGPLMGAGQVPPEDALEASTLCHIFSYLYLLESLYDGFYLVDSDLRVVIWNRGAERLLGHTTHEMLNRVWTSRILSYADSDGNRFHDHECPMHQVVATGKPQTSTLKLLHKSGEPKDVETQTVPLVDSSRQLHGVAEIFRDVSRMGRRPQEYQELRIAASKDPLTSVANRGELETQLALMLADYMRDEKSEPFSVIFLDVDHFKAINDRLGHTIGDAVLVELARLMQHETYSGELVGRYGGEEFVILCPATPLDQAVKRAERLRIAVSRMRISKAEGLQISASFGVTEVEAGDSPESIFRRADKALYQAKGKGRNQTCALTNADIASETAGTSDAQRADPFLFQSNFLAVTAADMVVYKLGGFVTDQQATLVEVTAKRAVLRLGATGFLGFWGTSPDRQPIEMQIEFGEAEMIRSRSPRVRITTRIRPRGWVRDPQVFERRARGIAKELMAYFVADLSNNG